MYAAASGSSSLQRGQVDDIFTQSAARQYGLGNSSLATGLLWRRRHLLAASSRSPAGERVNLAGEIGLAEQLPARLTAFSYLRGTGGIDGRKLAPLLQSEFAVWR